jgi:hypothetical protein
MKWTLAILGLLALLVALVAITGALLPVKHSATRKARFHRDPHTLYAVIAGPPDWRSDVKSSGALPDSNGRKHWFEEDSQGQRIAYELIEDSPPSKRVTRIAGEKLPFGGTWTIEIAPAADGQSDVRITEDGEIYNVFFRFVSRFVMGYYGTIDRYLKDLGASVSDQPVVE